MKVTVTCFSPTNFGIFVNGIFYTNYTDISGGFKPETYSIVLPRDTPPTQNPDRLQAEAKIRFLNVEYT